jgi:hypothetical protein
VAFSIDPDAFDNRTACHCSQCRRWSGHYWASVSGPIDLFSIDKGEEKLKWHHASDFARRGFCSECGSSLFWHAHGLDDHKDRIAVAFGALNSPTALKLKEHIFVADKGDYYEIGDGLPQLERE